VSYEGILNIIHLNVIGWHFSQVWAFHSSSSHELPRPPLSPLFSFSLSLSPSSGSFGPSEWSYGGVCMLLHAIVNHHGNNHSVASLVAFMGWATRKGQKRRKNIWPKNQRLIEFSFILFVLFFIPLYGHPPTPHFFPLRNDKPFSFLAIINVYFHSLFLMFKNSSFSLFFQCKFFSPKNI
jgi:hypothetical protein